MHSKLLTLLFTSLLLLSSPLSYAAEKHWYSIEYIVFKNTPLSNAALEPWRKAPIQIPVNAINLDNGSSNKFSQLEQSEQNLRNTLAGLKKSSSYAPIAHGGWIQPVQTRGKKQPVQIKTRLHNTELNGTITFWHERFFHLDFDLQLQERTSTGDSLNSNAPSRGTLYRLNETRRIKTEQIHYFDHPRFSVLAIVKKRSVAAPAPQPTIDSDASL